MAENQVDRMRAFVAKLPDTSERPHFGDSMFYVGKKPFASCGGNGVVVALAPEHAATLIDSDARFVAYPRAKHCVQFAIAEVKEWKELVRESYDLVVGAAKP